MITCEFWPISVSLQYTLLLHSNCQMTTATVREMLYLKFYCLSYFCAHGM